MEDLKKCPDCGQPINTEQTRSVQRRIWQEEVVDSDGIARMRDVYGYQKGEVVTYEYCSRCLYHTVDGRVVRRGRTS